LREGIKKSIKKTLYQYCLAGFKEGDLLKAGKRSSSLLTVIAPVAEQLQSHSVAGKQVWIVTATPRAFVQSVIHAWQWPVENVIGTEPEMKEGVYTGHVHEECSWAVKPVRIQEQLSQQQAIYSAYGNLPMDGDMLAMAIEKNVVDEGQLTRL